MIKICQSGRDGFGHQLEGTLRLISLSLNGKADYQYFYNKNYTFEHTNFNIQKLKQYFLQANSILSNCLNFKNNNNNNNYHKIIHKETRTFQKIIESDINYSNHLYLYDGVPGNKNLSPNFEHINDLQKSLRLLRKAFIKKNTILPNASFDKQMKNVCCHLRLGDAVGHRNLDTNNLIKVIKYYQSKNNEYRVIIHTDGDVGYLANKNTIIHGRNTDVLQVLSDFARADILVMNYSSLSIAAHLLGKNNQIVICPSNAGPTFKHRILPNCIYCDDFLKNHT